MSTGSEVRIAVFATHPVQYHAALWRALASAPGVDLEVFYFSDISVRGGVDPGFGVPVSWDVPVLAGYRHRFLSRDADIRRTWGIRIEDPHGILGSGRFDWVLLQGYTHAFERQVVRAARRLGIRVLLRGEFTDATRGGRVRSFAKKAYLRWFYSHVDRFCYLGEAAKHHLLGMGISGERMTFSPYHVDTDLFEDQFRRFSRESARVELGIPSNAAVVLFSGKFIPRKDPLLLLDALGRLDARGSIHAIFLGTGPLKREVAAKGCALLGKRFHAPGFVNQSELGLYFAAADVLVLPSRYETWGLVVNEAMQFGLPVVVSDRVGCRLDLVRPGKTGFVFPVGDPERLAAVLRNVVEDRDLARAMGTEARRLIEQYTPQAARDGILEAFRAERDDK